jgi:hypothetical protein
VRFRLFLALKTWGFSLMERPGFESSDDDESEYKRDTTGVTWLQLLWLPSYAEVPGATGDLMEVSISMPSGKNRGDIFILNQYEKKIPNKFTYVF